MTFSGFPEGKSRHIRIPEIFFRELLPQIDDLNELRLTLYVFWRLERTESTVRYLRWADLLADQQLTTAIGGTNKQAATSMDDALASAVQRGTLLEAAVPSHRGKERLIFANSPRGRAAVAAIQRGEWQLPSEPQASADVYATPPNIYQLYEGNIGPITPLLADALREAETTYPSEWIEEAFRIAVENNKRNWRYIEAILRGWQERGRNERKDRKDTAQARHRYRDWKK